MDSYNNVINPDIRTANSCNYNSGLISGKIFREWYHSHPNGVLPSAADLYKLGLKHSQGHINPENFTYGIVSSTGVITLVISSVENFKRFYETLKDEEGKNNYNSTIFSTSPGVPPTNLLAQEVTKLVKYFKDHNTGLDVICCPTTDEAMEAMQWDAYEVKVQDVNSGNLIKFNCNQ